ncbi:MAG: glycosyltransferase [Verrucomicrobiae bacterium]|nr:glycosyltransferase [Verrucomicrobiae bacterium]
MNGNFGNQPRVKVDGKFFRLGEKKFFPKGVTYGPFAPDKDGLYFPAKEQVRKDFELIRELGANLIRVYNIPPRWLVDLAAEFDLKLLIDIPWGTHFCFLDSQQEQENARNAVRSAVKAFAGHPAIFAYSVANEINPDIARWSGAKNVELFINSLVEEAKSIDPECLCTFGNFPPTEYLLPSEIDFLCFNVYLHQQKPFENYLSRLQMIAQEKPIIIGEFGFDSLRLGEEKKCELFGWQIRTIFETGFAGAVVFSFTDDWFRGGYKITDWKMGLTTEERQPKQSFYTVQREFKQAPYFSLSRYPKISVVVACYNGARTLKICLDSLFKLNYPDYEVILIDDGSTDATPQIARLYSNLRYFRQQNHGLSVARNTGIAMATGEIVAFTDADCRVDEDWLYYLAVDFLRSDFVGMGGPNFLPPEDSPVAAAVMASPGGPAHVMLTDRVAEHIPGCNMAFYKWALEEIDGFDPIFRKAGDDVDVCWRIQQRGYKIGFSPSAFVWHYRRSSVKDYLKQQYGYGEAEALLIRKHPEYFNTIGGSVWSGRIYTPAKPGFIPGKRIIYHGQFGSGMFQTLYTPSPMTLFGLLTSFEYHTVVTLPLLILSAPFRFLFPFAVINLLSVIGICVASGLQSDIPKNKLRLWSKPLVALLYFLQPIIRGYARYHKRLLFNPMPIASTARLDWAVKNGPEEPPSILSYWVETNVDRVKFLEIIQTSLDREGWSYRVDSGWNRYDIEIFGSRWTSIQLTTVSELYSQGKQVLKCRLDTAFSLPAKAVFCGVLALELLLIGLFGKHTAWAWMILVTMPVLLWYFSSDQKILKNITIHFIEEVAKNCGFNRVEEAPDSKARYKPIEK